MTQTKVGYLVLLVITAVSLGAAGGCAPSDSKAGAPAHKGDYQTVPKPRPVADKK